MSDNEDLYCNPQSNVFLQARKQNKPPKKLNEKKKLFGKKPASLTIFDFSSNYVMLGKKNFL